MNLYDELSLMGVLFLAPALLGAALGMLLGRRKPRHNDTSWRVEPTVRLDMYTTSDTDYLGRREPTFKERTDV